MPSGQGGTATEPITIKAAEGEAVILDGTDTALNDPAVWTDEGGNIYSTSISDTYYVGVDGNLLWRYDSQWFGTEYGLYYWLTNNFPLTEYYDLLHSTPDFFILFQEN
jgi:hypothetical protein